MEQTTPSKQRERALIDSALFEARRLAPTRAALPPTDSFPGYRITRLIRRGAQGVVYEAIDVRTNQSVAIKTLRSIAKSNHAQARFDTETALLRRLNHPHIVPILDSGEAPVGVYFVMPMFQGGVLDPVAWSQRPLAQRLKMLITVCQAVQAAHVVGVIHRDLKPGNILFDMNGQPFVADFGLAKLDENSFSSSLPWASLTISGEFVGSLAWASPEQWSSESATVDVRSDVYSLGVIGYQLMTGGRLPFGRIENIPEWIHRASRLSPTRPRAHARSLPRDVETIVLKAIQRSPEQRYQSAGELARDLERYLSREPIEARRDSVWYVLGRWIARRRAMAAMAALTITSLIAAAVIFSGALVRTRRAEQLEVAAAQRVEAINDYLLNDMLTAAKPDRDGRDTKVIEVLDRAAAGVADSFPNQYIIQAEINETIGESYMSLGAYGSADHVFAAAQEALAKSDAPSPDVAQGVANRYAKLRWLQGRHDEAMELFRQSYEQSLQTLGPENERTLEAMTGLAVLLRLAGNLDEARSLCQTALDARRKLEGPDGPETLTLLNNLAIIERQAGELDKAATYMKQVVESANRTLGVEHSQTLMSRVNFASILAAQGDATQAEQQLTLALAGQTHVLGADHPETAPVRVALARLRLSQGRSEEAEADLVTAINVMPSEAHLDRARAMVLLARSRFAQGRARLGVRTLDQAQAEFLSRGSTDGGSELVTQIESLRAEWRDATQKAGPG